MDAWGEILRKFLGDAEYRKYFCEDVREHGLDWTKKPANVVNFVVMTILFAALDLFQAIAYLYVMRNYAAGLGKVMFMSFYIALAAYVADFPGIIESADRYAESRRRRR